MSRFLHWFNNINFRKKLLLSFLVTAVVPLMVFGISLYTVSIDSFNKEIQSGIRDSAQNIAYIISMKANQYVTLSSQLLADDGFLRYVSGTDAGGSDREKEHTLANMNALLAAASVNQKDFKIYPAGESPEYIDEYFAETVWSVSESGVKIARRIRDPYKGSDLGYMEISFANDEFFDGFTIISYPEYGVIIKNRKEEYVLRRLSVSPPHKTVSIDAVTAGNPVVTYHGKRYITAASYVAALELDVTCFVPFTAEYTNGVVRITAVIGIIVAVLILISSLLFSATLSTRISALSRAMAEVRDGGPMKMSLKKGSRDEIGRLTEVFESMLDSINHYTETVYKKNLQLKEADIKVLQAQINPHFLYNSINIINWKAVILGDRGISDMVNNLSGFYRTSLNRGKSEILVSGELTNAKAYMNIQLELHQNSFEMEYTIDEQILNCQIINLTLQPILENAVEHGIDSVEVSVSKETKGKISLWAGKDEKALLFQVYNSGPPIDPEAARQAITNETKGYGLANVHKRIKLFFGDEYGIKIYPVEGGTVCEIRLPVIEAEPEVDADEKNI